MSIHGLKLRTQPTCSHCKAENNSNTLRFVNIDGVVSECAGCGMPLGDAEELLIPLNVETIYTSLIKRAAMRVKYFNLALPATESDKNRSLFSVSVNMISFESRAGKVQLMLDWFSFDRTQHEPRDVIPSPADVLEIIETFPPAVALTAREFINHGFVATEVPRRNAKEGNLRFRKVGSVEVKKDGNEWSEHEVIRAQLSW